MRTFENTSSPSGPGRRDVAGRLPVTTMDHPPVGTPFRTASYQVAPGTSTPVDRCVEMEFSVVMSGCALVEVASRIVRVEEGNAFLFESMESHVVQNDSADAPLVVVTTRWMPGAVGRPSRPDDVTTAIAGLGLAA